MRSSIPNNFLAPPLQENKIKEKKCRFCGSSDLFKIADLGQTAISNAFVYPEQDEFPETIYPLKLYFCKKCFLVQVDEYQKREDIFNESYVYFSSISKSWLQHSFDYSQMIIKKLNLNHTSQVVEIASNDGYLLQYFKQKSIPALGIEPTQSTALESRKKGIDTIQEFFNTRLAISLAYENKKADLIICNNVLAHDPHINDFIGGLKILLKDTGTITIEFPHLLKMIQNNEFDTIYQEHYSYFSILALEKILASHGLVIYQIDELSTHGGSLRIYIKLVTNKQIALSPSVLQVLEQEKKQNLDKVTGYTTFQKNIYQVKNDFLIYILNQKAQGKKIAGFGAAAKGNTFINYCGLKSDVIEYVVDETPIKQGKLLPQSHIPVVDITFMMQNKPEIIIIIPWNFKKEIIEKLKLITVDWKPTFVTYIPKLEISN